MVIEINIAITPTASRDAAAVEHAREQILAEVVGGRGGAHATVPLSFALKSIASTARGRRTAPRARPPP